MDASLIELLRCPETGQCVAPAPVELVQRLESLRLTGILLDPDNSPLSNEIQNGLVRADGARFFPVRDGIPVMLLEDCIEIPNNSDADLQ